jgi:hypothetical protein
MDLKGCIDNRLLKRIMPDKSLAASLIESSKNKLATAGKIALDEVSASSIITLCYDSLRELLEALAIQKGYKIYNHECYQALIKEVLKNDDFAMSFDRFRKIRNSINYYGKALATSDAQKIKKEMETLISDIKKAYIL